ncbi:hypothetical protein LBMAG46_27420 [Planctomycetia bacterium]|nr:hypothetical protein LBMAG46_27420 [Planctomycetia bacterium]
MLYEEGHTFRQSQKRFHRSALACILNNRFYIGELHRHGQVYVGRYERLIDQDIFDQCQNILHGRNRRTTHHAPIIRPSTGKVAEIWRGSNTTARRQILDSICLNRQVSDVKLVTSKRKPFDFFVERLPLKKSRGECPSFEREAQLVSEYVAESLELRNLEILL